MFKYYGYKDRMNQLGSASITTAELYSLNKRTSRSGNSSRDKQRQLLELYRIIRNRWVQVETETNMSRTHQTIRILDLFTRN